MYECTICLTLNHSSRLHCQCCGAVPAMYSLTGKVVQSLDSYPTSVQVTAAKGCQRVERIPAARSTFKTVSLDYYAPSAS